MKEQLTNCHFKKYYLPWNLNTFLQGLSLPVSISKFIRIFVTLILLYPSLAFCDEQIPITITADANYFPYSYLDKGKPEGLYSKILKKIFSNFDKKYRIEIKPLPWELALENVRNGKAFAVYPIYKLKNQRSWMDYSDPIFTENIALFCHNTSKKWPKDYQNIRIGFNYGFSISSDILKIFEKNSMKVFALDNNYAAVKAYQKEKIDCYVNDKDATILTNSLLKYKDIKEKLILETQDIYIGFSDQNNSEYKKDFISKFNEGLRQLKKDGEFDQIVTEFLKEK